MELNDHFVKREYRKLLFPMMLSVMSGLLTSLIDSILVNLKIGNNGITAINLCMPISLIIGTLGFMISGGTSMLAARSAGENKLEKGSRYYNTSIFMVVLIGIPMTVIGCALSGSIAAGLSQGTVLEELVRDYCFVLCLGTIPFAIAYIPMSFLQLEGRGRDITVMMILIVLLDTLMDWLFLFVVPLGMCGAALASVISMIVAAVYGFACLGQSKNGFQIQKKKLRFYDTGKVLKNGISIASVNLFDSMKMLLLNGIILKWGGLEAGAMWSVLVIFSELFRTITSGIPETAGPIISVISGSRENRTIRNLVKLELRDGVLGVGIFATLVFGTQNQIAAFYHLESNTLLPFVCLGVYMMLELVNNIWMNFFYRTSRPMLSMTGTLMRGFVCPVIFALVFSATADAIWLFLPAAQIAALFVMYLIAAGIARKSHGDHKLSSVLLLDDVLDRTNKVLDFSVQPTEEKICEASDRIKDFCGENDMDHKMILRLGLAIEELFLVLKEKNPSMKSADVRVYCIDGDTGIRVRSPGEHFNPFEDDYEGDMTGLDMIRKMAKELSYNYMLGVNNIEIHF